MDLKQLAQPFPGNQVKWRVGATTGDKKKGLALAYIDARAVMDRLDEACGPENWQSKIEVHGERVLCSIGINIKAGDGMAEAPEWVWKTDGAGATEVEGDKGGISDAIKRAAVHWGVGRYLYSMDSPWVVLDKYKKIDKSEFAKLDKLAGGTPTPAEPPTPPPPQPASPQPQPPPPQTKATESNGEIDTAYVEGVKKELEADGIHGIGAMQELWVKRKQDWYSGARNQETRSALYTMSEELAAEYDPGAAAETGENAA